MQVATFITKFDPITRATAVPLDKNGEPLPLLACWHVCREKDNTVVVKIKAEDAIMALIKADPLFQWLEDFDTEVTDAPK